MSGALTVVPQTPLEAINEAEALVRAMIYSEVERLLAEFQATASAAAIITEAATMHHGVRNVLKRLSVDVAGQVANIRSLHERNS